MKWNNHKMGKINIGKIHQGRSLGAKLVACALALVTALGLCMSIGVSSVGADDGEIYINALPELKLNDAEQAYVAGAETIRIAYVGGMAPAGHNVMGNFEGYNREYMDWISHMTGLQFEYVEIPEGTRITGATIKLMDCDLIVDVDACGVADALASVELSKPYFTTNKVFVSKKNVLDFKAKTYVAIPYGIRTMEEKIKALEPNIEFAEYKTIAECFDKVNSTDSYEAIILSQPVANAVLSEHRYSDYSAARTETPYRWESTIGFIPGTNGDAPELKSIINKAVDAIPYTLTEAMVATYCTGDGNRNTFADIFDTYKFVFIGGILIIGILVFVLILLARSRRHEKLERIRRKQEVYLQERRYKLIVDESEDVIFEVNIAANTCMNTDKMKSKFNWGFPKIMNNYEKEHFETLWLIPDEDRPKVKEIFEGSISSKLPSTDNIRIKTSAHDYLWCRVTMHPLMDKDGKVVSVIGKIVDIDSQVKEKRWLEMRSKMDGLTGLLNKVSFQADVADYMQTHKSTSCGIIFLDMDHFKQLNDTLGHMIGDKAIRDVAFSLTKIFGENDFISRFGGDEFCVFVMDITKEKLVEKLEKALQVMTLTYSDGGQEVTLTASIGAVYNLDPKITFKDLIGLADNKLYEAKENGRNRYVMTIKQ